MRITHFEGLSGVYEDAKSFFDKLFSIESDIFGECSVNWLEIIEITIKGLFKSVQRLEEFTILEVPSQVLPEVPDVTTRTTKMGMQVNWMDKVLGKIANKKDHLNLLKESKSWLMKLEQLHREREVVVHHLGETYDETPYKDYGLHQVFYYRLKVLKDLE